MIRLHDYFRSSAAYRVRIALNLKGVEYSQFTVNLVDGDQRSDDYRRRNPQGLVPTLDTEDGRFTQSLAIIDYIDATWPDPRLLPEDAVRRAHVLAMALAIACDIHPVNNLRILQYLKHEMGQPQDAIDRWYRHWIVENFEGLEQLAQRHGGDYLSGDAPGLADICLVPQMYNARRFEAPLDDFPLLVDYDAKAGALDAFAAAHPDQNK